MKLRRHRITEDTTLVEPDAVAPLPVMRTPREIGARPWRIGSKVGRTIYDDDHNLIGMMDTIELASAVVAAVNAVDR